MGPWESVSAAGRVQFRPRRPVHWPRIMQSSPLGRVERGHRRSGGERARQRSCPPPHPFCLTIQPRRGLHAPRSPRCARPRPRRCRTLCKSSQNCGWFPKYRPRRSGVSAVVERRPFGMSVIPPDRHARVERQAVRAQAAGVDLAPQQPSRVGDRRHGSIPCGSRRSPTTEVVRNATRWLRESTIADHASQLTSHAGGPVVQSSCIAGGIFPPVARSWRPIC